MKRRNNPNQTGNQNTRFNNNRTAPDVRDNLDSRKREEQDTKGDDITHNRKPHRNSRQQKEQ